MKPQHFALAMVANLTWAYNFIAGKVGAEHFAPLFFTSLRFFLLAAVLAAWIKLPPRDQWPRVVAVALVMGVLHFSFMFAGLAIGDNISALAIAVQLYVPMAALLAMVFLGERVGWSRAGGIGIAFAGVLVIGFDAAVFKRLDALLLVVGAAFFMAVANTVVRGMRGVGVFVLQGWLALISAPILLVLSLLIEDGQTAALAAAGWREWGAVVYAAAGASLVGHGIVYYLLRRYSVSLTTPLFLMTPVLAVVFGVVLWGDVLSWRLTLGGALTIAGVALITLHEARRARDRAR